MNFNTFLYLLIIWLKLVSSQLSPSFPPESWAPPTQYAGLLRESTQLSVSPTGFSSSQESPRTSPWCQWTDLETLECFVRTLDENFGSTILKSNWPSNFNQSSSRGFPSSRRQRGSRKIVSLRVFCHRLLLYQSVLTESTFKGLEEIEELAILQCKLSSIPKKTLLSFTKLKLLTINSLNREWAALSLEMSHGSLPVNVEEVHLSHNNLWKLPRSLFCPMKSLILLNVSYNHIQNIDELGFVSENDINSAQPHSDEPLNGHQALKNEAFYNQQNPQDYPEREDGTRIPSLKNHSDSLSNKELTNSCKTSLQYLLLDFNDIVRLSPRSFNVFPDLVTLSLANNDIRILSNRAFEGLHSLQLLNLSGNHLVKIFNSTFYSCTNLEKLYLYNNSIVEISPNIFKGLGKLQVLDLSFNKLSIGQGYEDFFQDLRRLVILDMSHNTISSIPISLFRDLSSLQKLDLSFNRLEFIQSDAFKGMFNLYELHLSHNQISTLSKFSFTGLVGLNHLDLEHNEIKSLHPNLLAQSSNLRSIMLSHNKFEEIPKAIANLPFVKTVDLSSNNIIMVEPFNFEGLSNLNILNLKSNLISNISQSTFNGLVSLSELDLSDNNIYTITERSLDRINGLTVLNLSRNKLKDIDGLFAGMEELEELNLAENSINRFDYAFLPRQLLNLNLQKNEISQLGNYYKLHNFLALEVLDASFNNIKSLSEVSLPNSLRAVFLNQNIIQNIEPGTFLDKTQIQKINLRMNQLYKLNPKSVGPKWISKDQKEAQLLLGGNPLVCDCEMEWLYQASVPRDSNLETLEANHRIPLIEDVSDVVCTLLHNSNNRTTYTKVIDTQPEDYLCPYAAHCFALCKCCDFIACDCRMNCPSGCSCYHDDTWSMNLVDCSRGNLQRLPDKVPMDATIVYLDGNNLNVLHAHHFIGRHSVKKLYLNNSNIQTLQNRTFHGLTSLKTLYLQNNMIVQLNGFEFSGLFQLKELHLQNNRISFLKNSTFTGLKTLEMINLENNFLVDFPVWMLGKNLFLQRIIISNNPWDCNCLFIKELKNWLVTQNNLIDNPQELFCVVDDSGTVWPGITRPEFNCIQSMKNVTPYRLSHHELPFLAGGLCAGVALVTGLIVIVTLIIRKRAAEAHKLGFSTSSSFTQDDEGKVFDAYISYSACDSSFVRDVLATRLENATPSYKLCLQSRDFIENSRVSESISQSICFSKRVVIILSKNYAESEWRNSSFRQAHLDNLKAKENSIITINFDGVSDSDLEFDLKGLVKKSNRIRWGDKNFWRRLTDLLPPKSVYSAFSVYISDPLYKSPVPLLGPPRTMDLPSSSSVLTTTTGLPTPSEGGRISYFQECPTTYKSAPPPRPCNQTSSRDYIYMSGHANSCNCQAHSHTGCYLNTDTSSVHTYNSLEVLTHQLPPCSRELNHRASSPESNHYSVINTPAPFLNSRQMHRSIERKGHYPIYEARTLNGPLCQMHDDISHLHYGSLRKGHLNHLTSHSSDSDSQGGSSYSSSGKLDNTSEGEDGGVQHQLSPRGDSEPPLEPGSQLPGLPTDECFV